MTDVVQVWLVSVGMPPDDAARCREVLDDGELARAAALADAGDRQRFTAAHGALRILVGRTLNVAPADLRWTTGPRGKPELVAPWSGLLRTSLSHSAGMAAAAVSSSRSVGVDIQEAASGVDVAGLSARFFPAAEADYVAVGERSVQADRFAALWARKEAVVKASGGRLWANLRMPVRDRKVVCLIEPPRPHRVADIVAPPGFRAAVALTGTAPFVLHTATWPTGSGVTGP